VAEGAAQHGNVVAAVRELDRHVRADQPAADHEMSAHAVNLERIRHLVCTAMAVPRILHVVPHPGGGGETYIRELDALDGFRFDPLAPTENRHPYETPRGLMRLRRAIPDHDLLHIHGDSASLVSLPVIGRLPAVITLNGVHLARRMRGARGWAV